MSDLKETGTAMFTRKEIESMESALSHVWSCLEWLFREYIGSGDVNNSGSRDHDYDGLDRCCNEFINNMDKELAFLGLGVLKGSYSEGCKIVSYTDPDYERQMIEEERSRLRDDVTKLEFQLMKAKNNLEKFNEVNKQTND